MRASPEGARQRREILAGHGLALDTGILEVPRRLAGPDDLLDAAACALAAERMLAGQGCRLPDEPAEDSRGLRMEIWY